MMVPIKNYQNKIISRGVREFFQLGSCITHQNKIQTEVRIAIQAINKCYYATKQDSKVKSDIKKFKN